MILTDWGWLDLGCWGEGWLSINSLVCDTHVKVVILTPAGELCNDSPEWSFVDQESEKNCVVWVCEVGDGGWGAGAVVGVECVKEEA